MITYSIINKSKLEGALRLDAEYYQPEFVTAEEKIKQLKYLSLGSLCTILTDYHANGSYSNLHNNIKLLLEPDYALMIRAVDLQHGSYKEDVRYVSKDAYNFLNKTKIFGDELIVDKIGNAGEVYLMPTLNKPVTLGMNLFLLRLKKDVNSQFVYIFLNSSYGKKLIYRRVTGSNPPSIDKNSVRSVPIPIFSKDQQETIKQIINNSFEEDKKSVNYYTNAENLLLEELGLKDYKVEDDLSFIINLSDLKSAQRTDSNFFQPKYDRILNKLVKVDKLKSNFDIIKSKSFTYKENGEIGVIQTKQLGKQFINFQTEKKTTEEIIKRESLPLIKNEDVLFASMGVGSLGKSNVVYDSDADGLSFTIDSTLRIFRKKKESYLLPEVLCIYLSSIIGQELIYKFIVGSSGIISIYDNYLREFPIPILPKEIQKKIADLVRKSHEARKKSKYLLAEAKRKVEEMIEKGGNNV